MKKYLFLLLAAAQGVAAFAQSSNSDQPYLTKALPAATQKAEVQTSGGNILVEGAHTNDARVEMYVRDNQGRNISQEEIEQKMKNYDVTVEVVGGTLRAIAKNKTTKMDWKKGLSISFKVYAPTQLATDLSTSGGNITLTQLEGNQKFRTSGGNLRVDNVSGDIAGGTSGGNVSVSNANDNIKLSTSGGNIEATQCKGTISVSTSGGNVRISNLSGNIKASTSGGNINGSQIEGALSAHTSGGSVNLDHLAGSIETSTSGGSMNVQVSKPGEYVRLSNSGGSIKLQLPKDKGLDLHLAGSKINTGSLTNFSGSVEDDRIDGKMNGGGSSIIVKTSGHVSLSLQ